MRYLAKTLVFCFVCFVTFLVTSSLIAQPGVKKSNATKAGTVEWLQGHQAPSVNKATDLQPVSSLIFMPKVEIKSENGIANVSAVASITDINTSQLYAWQVKILDVKGDVINDHVYVDHAFFMELDGHMEPAFNDTFALPEGAKHVSLSLYALPMNIGLSAFENDDKGATYEAVRGVKPVSP